MQSDFSAVAKNARLQLSVPPFDFDAIRARSTAFSARERLRRLLASAVIGLGIVGAATALASTVGGWHLSIFGNKAHVSIQSLGMIRYPHASEVRELVARAAFTVTLPADVPPELRVTWIAYSPIEQPTLMTVQYGNASQPYATSVTLIDAQTLNADQQLLPPGVAPDFMTKAIHFRIGREVVFLGTRTSPADAQRIQSAMEHESPAQTASAFNTLLPRITVLQKVTPQVAEVAERLAPPGNNVVVADWDIRIIPRLAAHGQPLRDSRTIYLTNIPQVHGQPDYRNATLTWPKAVAIAPDGVRAVAAALRRSHINGKCNCAILVHAANGAYAIWKIDARTLQSIRLQQ
jgi:hypothetical protein